MFQGESLSHFSTRNVIVWLILAFQAGVINVGGFLACQRFVSHVTGFSTLFGHEVARGQWLDGLGMLSVPAFFVLGAMISAFLIDRRILQNRLPRYATAMFLMAGTNFALLIAGNIGLFGTFGEPLILARDYTLLALLCFVSGLQNAMVTSASGAVVRTTHLTGITTDLGIGIVRMLFQTHHISRSVELRATEMRIGVIAAFTLGSAVAAFIFLNNQYWGFALPAAISTGLWIWSLRHFPRHPALPAPLTEARS